MYHLNQTEVYGSQPFKLCKQVSEYVTLLGILFWQKMAFVLIGLRIFVCLFYRAVTFPLLVEALQPLISKEINSRIEIKFVSTRQYQALTCQQVLLIISPVNDAC